MKNTALYTTILCAAAMSMFTEKVIAQGIHFSQYYNAPMLQNPANTALMSDYDYRVGANYRNQWATIPVPYNTASAWVDLQAFRKDEGYSWLGIGGAFFSDKAGDGNLALNRFEGDIAYHLGLNDVSMLSFGLSGGYVQRSIDFSKLTFDQQWDGFTFNGSLPNGEKNYVQSTNYTTVGAGLNYAYFPDENVYLKVGAGVANINQPKESFYNMSNQVAMRPIVNVDAIFKMNEFWTANPSMYFTTQSGATEFIFGSIFKAGFGAKGNADPTNFLILGAFYRLNESVIGVVGIEWNSFQVTASYDMTASGLSPYTGGYGAAEVSLIYKGMYGVIKTRDKGRRSTNCPRF
jgi:type IX secretion system PorP/SprF family membrane protein